MVNQKIMIEISKNHTKDSSEKFTKFTNLYLKKMTDNLVSFSYNVLIANLHEMYSFLNKETDNKYTKETLSENYRKILTTLLPIIPHFASECLELNKFKMNQSWPTYDEKMLIDKTVKVVVQINGKKRAILDVERDISEENILLNIKKNDNLKKYLGNNKLSKVIFIKNKIINIIV